jgi:hypothetical protein
LARRPDGIFVVPFEQGEIGPDLFRRAYESSALRAWCQSVAAAPIAREQPGAPGDVAGQREAKASRGAETYRFNFLRMVHSGLKPRKSDNDGFMQATLCGCQSSSAPRPKSATSLFVWFGPKSEVEL